MVDAFGIFLMRQFIETFPNDLIDAARIDGSGEFGIYRKIVLPQMGAALATLGIFTFMGTWNDYLWPLIVITTTEKRTLPVMLTWYNSQHGARFDLTMAASMLVLIPCSIGLRLLPALDRARGSLERDEIGEPRRVMREKIVLIGAGSAMFTRGLVADLIRLNWTAMWRWSTSTRWRWMWRTGWHEDGGGHECVRSCCGRRLTGARCCRERRP